MSVEMTEFDISTGERELSDADLQHVSSVIHASSGIALSPSKREMVRARLGRRMRALHIQSFSGYVQFLKSVQGPGELPFLLDVISTNTTSFFREPRHFELLREVVLPTLSKPPHRAGAGSISLWSAGCSRGNEAYTLAMTVHDYSEKAFIDFDILGTDISHPALEKARLGVYGAEEVDSQIPDLQKRRYMLKGTGAQVGNYRVVPELRDRVRFAYCNLMEGGPPGASAFNIIFCRNVMIYFDAETRARLIRGFYDLLAPGGYLFIGHSETLHGLSSQFEMVEPTVYRRGEQ